MATTIFEQDGICIFAEDGILTVANESIYEEMPDTPENRAAAIAEAEAAVAEWRSVAEQEAM